MRRALARLASLGMPLVLGLVDPSTASASDGLDRRWTAATPDVMIERAARRVAADGDDALARLMLIDSLAAEASAGHARSTLANLGRGATSLATTARWLARALEPESANPPSGFDGPSPDGLVRSFSVLGPFENTGGGLVRREGVELPGFDFRTADASWGAMTVKPVRALASSITARGLPLDLYVHPRRESCSYLATAVTVPTAQRLVVAVAASGSYRLAWDGHDAAGSAEHHRRARLDRGAVAIDAAPGQHLIVIKSCSGAQEDNGRVRVRLARPDGSDLDLAQTSEPAALQAALEAARSRPADRMLAVLTPLERAVSVGREPTIAESLHAATVRLLAGADDLQSPRAPGMLGLIAATQGVDAQTLALAGYLAPAGANRSGWLRRALEHAAAERDEDALAFAQRTLILAQLGSQQQDLALATSQTPPFSLARDPQAELIRAEIEARLGGLGLSAAAIGRLERETRARGVTAPEAVWRALAQFSQRTGPETHLAALDRLVAMAPGYRGERNVVARRIRSATELERAALADRPHLDDARILTRIGNALLTSGKPASAFELFSASAALSPNRAEAHLGLARSLQASPLSESFLPTIQAALRRARELEPSATEITAELGFREGRKSGSVEVDPRAAMLVPPEEFLARAKAKPLPKDGVFARQLHWRRVVRMLADRRISQTIHYAREIGVEPRSDEDRVENVPEAGPTSELLVARLHRPDGSVLEPEEKDSTGGHIRWPQLRRGDVVEVAVRSFTPGPVGRRGDAPYYFVDYVGSVSTEPILYNEVVIDNPDGSPLAFDVIGGKPDRTLVSREGDRTVTRLIWDTPPTIADEPLAPPASETMPIVVGSIYPTWKDFLAWYRGAIEGFTVPDEQIKQVARELTVGKTSREEKLEALFNYVADDIRYVNYTSSEWWLPNRPQHLLARRQGDCDDKANLLIGLLRAVDIEATEVLIQTRMTGQPRILLESKIAVPMFDHGIVYLADGKGGGRYLDATSPQSRLGTTPSMDARAAAVLVQDGAVSVLATPPSSPEEHGIDARWTLEVAADGSAKVAATEHHVGDAAFVLRTNLGQVDARAQWVELNLVARSLPSAKLEGEVGFDGSLPNGAARVEYRAFSQRLARKEGLDLVLALAPPTPLTMQLAPLHERTLPVQLPANLAPSHHDVHVEVVVPAGYRVAAVPPDDSFVEPSLGSAKQTFRASPDGRRLSLERSVRFDASHIQPDRYQAWRAWLRDVDRMLRRTVRLVPVKD
ncbi:MAG: hypothetical protein FJ096_07625 [Deltaproteobacteria bacterium]|nr:hypothetical protein [Deltaproteobacteria bacterium]